MAMAMAVARLTVVDLAHTLYTGIIDARIVAIRLLRLVPIQDPPHEGRDESDAGLGARDGLAEAEEQGEVAVDLVLRLELARGLDALPGRGYLDEDPVFGDA